MIQDDSELLERTISTSKFEGLSGGGKSFPPLPQDDLFERDQSGGIAAKQIKGPGVYYFGIIDILQEYNLGKQLERWAKIFFKRQEPDGISSIDPDRYADRFIRYAVDDVFELPEQKEETV